MRLYWVRHGEMEVTPDEAADFDTVNRMFNGEDEGDLSERGRREAECVARFFRETPVDYVYSSRFARARQTAAPTAEALQVEPQILDSIGELRTGRLPAGSLGARLHRTVYAAPMLRDETRRAVSGAALIPIFFRAWQRGSTVGGETVAELLGRVRGTFQQLRSSHREEARVALFSHGYLIHYQCARLVEPRRARLAAWRYPYIPNGSITEMELGGGGRPRLVRYVRTEHLR